MNQQFTRQKEQNDSRTSPQRIENNNKQNKHQVNPHKQQSLLPECLKMESFFPLKHKIKKIDLSHNRVMPKFYLLDSISYRSNCALGNKSNIRLKEFDGTQEKIAQTERAISRERCMAFNILKQQAHVDNQQFVPPIDFTPFIVQHQEDQELLLQKQLNKKYSYKVFQENDQQNIPSRKEINSPLKQRCCSQGDITSPRKQRNSSNDLKSSQTNFSVFIEKPNDPIEEDPPSPIKIKRDSSSLQQALTSRYNLIEGRDSQRSPAQLSPVPRQRQHYQLIQKELIKAGIDENESCNSTQRLSQNIFRLRSQRSQVTFSSQDEPVVGLEDNFLPPTRAQQIYSSNQRKRLSSCNEIQPIKLLTRPSQSIRASEDVSPQNNYEESKMGGVAANQFTKYVQQSANNKAKAQINSSISRLLNNLKERNSTFGKKVNHHSEENSHLDNNEKQQARKLKKEGKKLSLDEVLQVAHNTLQNLRDLFHINKNRDYSIKQTLSLTQELPLVKQLVYKKGFLKKDLKEGEIFEFIQTQQDSHQDAESQATIQNKQESNNKTNQFEWEPFLELISFNFRLSQLLDKQRNQIIFNLEEQISQKPINQIQKVALDSRRTPSREKKMQREVKMYSNLIESINDMEKNSGRIEFLQSTTKQNYSKLTDIMKKQQVNESCPTFFHKKHNHKN